MKCSKCGKTLNITDFTESDGITNQPFDIDRITAVCPDGHESINTRYDPRDWWTEKQMNVIKRLMKKVVK